MCRRKEGVRNSCRWSCNSVLPGSARQINRNTMVRIRRPYLQFVVMVLAALSFVLLGAAHRMPSGAAIASDYQGVDLAAYVLPDGTLPDLCNPSAMDEEGKDGQGCPACMLAKTLGLATPPALPNLTPGFAIIDAPVRSDPNSDGHSPRAPPARGPPQLRIA